MEFVPTRILDTQGGLVFRAAPAIADTRPKGSPVLELANFEPTHYTERALGRMTMSIERARAVHAPAQRINYALWHTCASTHATRNADTRERMSVDKARVIRGCSTQTMEMCHTFTLGIFCLFRRRQ